MNRSRLENILLFFFVLGIISVVTLILLNFSGCCEPPQTIIRDRIIEVTPPVIHDTVPAIQYDTVIIGTNIFEKDTVAIIKYFPKWKYFDYKIKPDTIRLTIQDTVTQTRVVEKNIETSLLSKFGLVCLGAILGIISILIILWKR